MHKNHINHTMTNLGTLENIAIDNTYIFRQVCSKIFGNYKFKSQRERFETKLKFVWFCDA